MSNGSATGLGTDTHYDASGIQLISKSPIGFPDEGEPSPPEKIAIASPRTSFTGLLDTVKRFTGEAGQGVGRKLHERKRLT